MQYTTFMFRLVVMLLLTSTLPVFAAGESTIAVIGLLHSHVWGHLEQMIAASLPRLVGIAETNTDLIDEARKMGAGVRSSHRRRGCSTSPSPTSSGHLSRTTAIWR